MNRNCSIKLTEVGKFYSQKLRTPSNFSDADVMGYSNSGVSKRAALSGLSLSIEDGERVGIIGQNGAGKSTLLQIISGILAPTSGEMSISGKVTAILTLGSGLREDLSGRENIYLDFELHGKSKRGSEDDVEAVIEFAELGKFIDFPMRTYSTGMKARLAFSLVAHVEPEILIIDESLSVGDAAFSAKAGKRIKQLCDQGAIVIIASHSMYSINELCSRCLWLDKGHLVMDGHPETVTRAYSDSVRVRDENDVLEKFKKSDGTHQLAKGFKLSELYLISDNKKIQKLTSGEPLNVVFEWWQVKNEDYGIFLLRCIRLDDSFIFEQEIIAAELVKKQKLCVTYPNFNLAAGLYRMQLTWQDSSGALRAESSTFLEIVSQKVPSGGRPVLLNVGDIKVIKFCEESLS